MNRPITISKALVAVGALALAAAAHAVEPDKSDPLYQSKGDQKRVYKLPATGAMVPYRTFVPASWAPGKKLPLVLVLHGGGLDENGPFERSPAPLKNELQKMAEEFGYIIVSPNGLGSGFGAPPPPGLGGPAGSSPGARPGQPPAGAGGPRPAGAPTGMQPPPFDPMASALSEQDVLNVVEIVEKEYGVDTSKEFITGNSMGGIGTVYLARRHPGKWLAMAPSEAGYQVDRYPGDYKIKGALLIHKQNAAAPEVETKSAEMVKYLAAQGVEAYTISVPNTVHENVWFFTLPETFHFFDKFVQQK